MELVTLKTFDNSIDAHLLKSKLESSGIRCYLYDENIVTLNRIFNISVGGIKLKINQFDTEKASEIVKEWDRLILTNDNGERLRCPQCNSYEIYSRFKSMKGPKGMFAAIISFLFMVFPFFYKTVYKCKVCDTEFQ